MILEEEVFDLKSRLMKIKEIEKKYAELQVSSFSESTNFKKLTEIIS